MRVLYVGTAEGGTEMFFAVSSCFFMIMDSQIIVNGSEMFAIPSMDLLTEEIQSHGREHYTLQTSVVSLLMHILNK